MEPVPDSTRADDHGQGAGRGRGAGRPRSESAHRAVLEAAYATLEEGGIEHFSIDRVGRRSGVARTTIYRWWPSKAALAIESFFHQFEPQVTGPRSGVPDEDFRELVRSLVAAL